MLSKTLIAVFSQAERLPQPLELQESLSKLKEQIESLAIRQACLRCSKAGHMLKINSDHRVWTITQIKCDDYRALPPHIDGFGIGFPCEPKFIYFCDEEAGGGGGITEEQAEDPGQRQRGFVEAERENAQQIQIDRER